MSWIASLTLVALGGALGGVLRVWVTAAVERRMGTWLPWGTLAVNASGSAVAGLAGALFLGEGQGLAIWTMGVIGVLGSYTTVSSFALQCHALAVGGRGWVAVLYVGLSLALCLTLAGAGFRLGAAG